MDTRSRSASKCLKIVRLLAYHSYPIGLSRITYRYQTRFRLQGVLPILQVPGYTHNYRVEVRGRPRTLCAHPLSSADPVIFAVVRSGMEPLIRAILTNLVGDEDANYIEIISNSVDVHDDGSWNLKYRHPSR